ncbi:MAG: hypothetical protein ABI794_07290 [Betaproteobacteria bacterium]
MSEATPMLPWLSALSVLALGACATVAPMEIQPLAPLVLQAPAVPSVPLHPTRVTVTNGRGEVLLDGAPDSEERLSANPPPIKFDGTLTVKTEYDNGTSKFQTLTHDPTQRVNIAWDKSLDQYVLTSATRVVPSDLRRAHSEPGWALQVFGDYKLTPYGSTTVSSTGSAVVGAPDLGTSMASVGVGIRRYFATTAAGIQPFAYAAYSEYFGNSVRAADVTYHFGNAPDTGGQIKEDRSFLAGFGAHFELAPTVGLDIMAGVHATRMRVSVFSDERSGGGPYNEFSSDKWLFGPTLGGQVSIPLFLLGPGSPVFLFMQYQAMLMDDVSHSGTSPFTANTYSVNADGGIQSKIMFGFEKKF